jgi:hypothetical protein
MKYLIQLGLLLVSIAGLAPLAAQRQPRVVDSVQALVALTPSQSQPDVIVSDTTNGFRLFRYLPSSTEDTNTSAVFGTSIGTGRWKRLPLLGQTNSTQYLTSEAALSGTDPVNGYFARVFTGSTSGDWTWNPAEGGPDVSGERVRPTNYVTGSWIKTTAWATSKSIAANKAAALDLSGQIVASSATKQQVDNTSTFASTITGLRSFGTNLNNGTVVYVSGYYASGDGGGGSYYYDSSDTSSADNGYDVIVGQYGARFKALVIGEVNARRFGVHPSASQSTNVAGLNYALTNYGAVYLPRGTYQINETVYAYRAGGSVNFRGDGKNLTELVQYSSDVELLRFGNTSSSLSGMALIYNTQQSAGLSGLSPTTNTNSYALSLYRAGRFAVRDVRTYNAFVGVGVLSESDANRYAFSGSFDNLDVRCSTYIPIFIQAGSGAGNTGNTFNNTYINQLADDGTTLVPCVNMVRVASCTEGVWNQLNLEAALVHSHLIRIEETVDVQTFNSVHIEYVQPTNASTVATFYLSDNNALIVNGLQYERFYFTTTNGCSGNYSHLRFAGSNIRAQINGLRINTNRWDSAGPAVNTDIANAFRVVIGAPASGTISGCRAVFFAADQGSTFSDGSYPSALGSRFLLEGSRGTASTDPMPLLWRWNEQVQAEEVLEASSGTTRRMLYSNTDPSSGSYSWTSGDRVRRVSSPTTGSTMEFICTSTGTPGTWFRQGGQIGFRNMAAVAGTNPYSTSLLYPLMVGEIVINTTPTPNEVWIGVNTSSGTTDSWQRIN